MPHWDYCPHPDGTTQEEFHKLLSLRRQVLDDATRAHNLGQPLPITWRRGWKNYLKILGRDRDGSLKASYSVYEPNGALVYVRKVRLVRSQRLPSELGQGWRES
jgi:hypothetical protein